MALQMRAECEKCGNGLDATDEAFCADCTNEMNSVCPTGGGELVRRPKRKV